MNTFTEMQEALKQYHDGLITFLELTIKMQMTEKQAKIACQVSALPYQCATKIDAATMDKAVADDFT